MRSARGHHWPAQGAATTFECEGRGTDEYYCVGPDDGWLASAGP
jgi:hypothetical protein